MRLMLRFLPFSSSLWQYPLLKFWFINRQATKSIGSTLTGHQNKTSPFGKRLRSQHKIHSLRIKSQCPPSKSFASINRNQANFWTYHLWSKRKRSLSPIANQGPCFRPILTSWKAASIICWWWRSDGLWSSQTGLVGWPRQQQWQRRQCWISRWICSGGKVHVRALAPVFTCWSAPFYHWLSVRPWRDRETWANIISRIL